jgi:hypothetical protein
MGNMRELAVMDQTGDTKTVWDSRNADEVENARETFDRLKKKGYAIYKVGKKGEPGEVMHKFDPDAESMIATPRVVGG